MSSAKANLPLFLLLALLVSGIWLWQDWRGDRAGRAVKEIARSADLDALLNASYEEFSETAKQAIRGASLSSGSEGQELWHLRADFVAFRDNSDQIDLKEPIIHYAMGQGEARGPDSVRAEARTGSVRDNNSIMSMLGEVDATWKLQRLQGPEAIFRNTDRIMVMPQGGEFYDQDIWASGNILRWDLENNILYGEEGVKVIWTPPAKSEQAPAEAEPEPGLETKIEAETPANQSLPPKQALEESSGQLLEQNLSSNPATPE